MDINELKFTQIANTALMIADSKGVMRWANDAYSSLTGLHLPMWLNRDTGDISRAGYLKIHGNSGLLYETVQKTGNSVTCRIDFPKSENVITTAMPIKSDTSLDSIVYILTLPVDGQKDGFKNKSSGVITSKLSKVDTNIVISSPDMEGIYLKATQVAPFTTSVLITGESGVGKDVLSRFIHSSSPRHDKPFIHLNCSALPESLFESEVFGYESGAFTGAMKGGKGGLLELANGGTLFLDEIGDLPLSLQPKLLTFLSSGEYMKVGSGKVYKSDVRIISATNSNMRELVHKKLFREELYYRLSTVELNIPPLRERHSEIGSLIKHFTTLYNEKYNKNAWFDKETVSVMKSMSWYGNIRELTNIIERLILFSVEDRITVQQLYLEYNPCASVNHDYSLKNQMKQHEKIIIEKVLKNSNTLQQAADVLCIDLSTLTRKRQKYKI